VAEAFAVHYRVDPRIGRQWAEAAPAVVRAYFQAIRDTTRDKTRGQRPPNADPAEARSAGAETAVQLTDLSPDLQHFLKDSWRVWDSSGRARS
jgi:hypothetical protein